MQDLERMQLMEQIRESFEKNAQDVKCSKCSNDLFDRRIKIKRVSEITSPTGKEIILPLEIYICNSCGEEIQGY